MFATRADLLTRSGLTRELAQVATPEDCMPIPPGMLRIAIDKGDLSSYGKDDKAACTLVLGAIDQALGDASDLIAGYGLTLPGDTGRATTPTLTRICCDIALYYLYRLRLTEEIETRYKNAIALLDKYAKGMINLAPPVDTDGDGDVDSDDDQSSVAGGVITQQSQPPRYTAIYVGSSD